MKIIHFPLVKVFTGFLIGLILAYSKLLPDTILFTLAIASVLFLLATFLLKKHFSISNKIFDAAILFTSLVLGACVLWLHTENHQKDHYHQYSYSEKESGFLHAIILEKLKKSGSNDRYVAQLHQVNSQKVKGKILLNLTNPNGNKLEIGTIVRIQSRLRTIPPPRNPFQFDYANYLKQKQIYAQVFASVQEIQYQKNPQKNLWYYTSKIRNTIATNLKESGMDHTTLSITMALLLGQQQEIDSHLIKDYQFAGAVHILSVSGLHIGCLVLFLNFLMQPISNSKKGRTLKLIILLLSLALFGVLAGLAPSVLRSVTMFSFVAIGNYWNKHTNIYHTLLVSAFLILLFNPFLLFDVGFQLSYAALFFIVWLQPIFANLWQVKNKILLFFWNIITVSFAAQIGTLPLSLYYFHQFPSLFFVTNLAVLPLLSVIMVIGVIVMIVALFGKIPFMLLSPLVWGIELMNSIIHWVASIESLVFQNISFSLALLLSTYLLIVFFFIGISQKSFYAKLLFLVCLLSIQLYYLAIKISQQNERELIVLHTPKSTTLCERKGKAIAVYSSEKKEQNYKQHLAVQYYVTGAFGQIKTTSPLKNTFYCKHNKILVVDSKTSIPLHTQFDLLVLSKNPKLNLDRVITQFRPKMVIADGSNYSNMIQKWKKSCNQQKIPFHATAEKGYFVIRE